MKQKARELKVKRGISDKGNGWYKPKFNRVIWTCPKVQGRANPGLSSCWVAGCKYPHGEWYHYREPSEVRNFFLLITLSIPLPLEPLAEAAASPPQQPLKLPKKDLSKKKKNCQRRNRRNFQLRGVWQKKKEKQDQMMISRDVGLRGSCQW